MIAVCFESIEGGIETSTHLNEGRSDLVTNSLGHDITSIFRYQDDVCM